MSQWIRQRRSETPKSQKQLKASLGLSEVAPVVNFAQCLFMICRSDRECERNPQLIKENYKKRQVQLRERGAAHELQKLTTCYQKVLDNMSVREKEPLFLPNSDSQSGAAGPTSPPPKPEKKASPNPTARGRNRSFEPTFKPRKDTSQNPPPPQKENATGKPSSPARSPPAQKVATSVNVHKNYDLLPDTNPKPLQCLRFFCGSDKDCCLDNNEINRTYKKESILVHPDKNKSEDGSKIKKLNVCRDIVLNNEARKELCLHLASAAVPHAATHQTPSGADTSAANPSSAESAPPKPQSSSKPKQKNAANPDPKSSSDAPRASKSPGKSEAEPRTSFTKEEQTHAAKSSRPTSAGPRSASPKRAPTSERGEGQPRHAYQEPIPMNVDYDMSYRTRTRSPRRLRRISVGEPQVTPMEVD